MITLKGRGIIPGHAIAPALVTQTPMNFTAAFTTPKNLIPGRLAVVQDRHHDLYKKSIKDAVLIFPACIGSTITGIWILQIVYKRQAPAAMIVKNADSLLTSGLVLSKVWFNKGIPVVEYDGDDLFTKISTGDLVEVDGDSGVIKISSGLSI